MRASRRRLAWAAIACGLCAPASPAFPAEGDPWAPGASRDPWALISTLQSSGAQASGAGGWEAAFGHHDPLVRAAACRAVGRARPAGAARLLAPLITDPDTHVRDAALWAALRLDDAASLPLVARALAVRRRLNLPGTLFERRGIPAAVAARGAEFRRDWLADVDLAQLRPGHRYQHEVEVQSASLSVERSEWDAGERATLRATLETTAGGSPKTLPLASILVPLEEQDLGAPQHSKRSIPVALRRPDADERDSLRLDPGQEYDLELILPLHDIPPGAYWLEPLPGGHPLYLRIRRSARREAEVQRAALEANTAEQIEAAGWQRVAAAAPRLRERLRAELAGERGALTWTLLAALARLEDTEAAGLMIDALRDRRGLSRPNYSYGPLFDLKPFGAAALPHLERLAGAWTGAVARIGGDGVSVEVLRAAGLATPALDAARVAALRALAADVRAGPPESNQGHVFLAALAGAAPRQPQEAGRALAAIAGRPPLLLRALQEVDPYAHSASSHPTEVDALETIVMTAWKALDRDTPADSRSALAAVAERFAIPLDGRQHARPETAAEAARQLARGGGVPRRASTALLQRVLASGLDRVDGDVARYAAERALDLFLYEEAARLAERAIELAPPERRGTALYVRSRARAALGDQAGQLADLEAAAGLVKERQPPYDDVRRALEKRRGERVEASLRVRAREGRWAWAAVAYHEGSVVVAGEDLRIDRRDIRGGVSPVAVAPWPVHGLAPLGAGGVVAIAHDGSLALLRGGGHPPVWEARVEEFCDQRLRCGALAADRQTIVVRDSASQAHAFDTATGLRLWTLPAAESPYPVVNGSDPVVLGTPPEREQPRGHPWAHVIKTGPPPLREIRGVDPRTGRTAWSVAQIASAGPWTVAARRVAWLDNDGAVRVVDVRDGREVMRARVVGDPPTHHFSGRVALSLDGSRAYVGVGDRLFAVDATGVLWSYVPDPPADEARRPTIGALVAGQDAVWASVYVPFGGALAVFSPSGARIAERRWSQSSVSGPGRVDDRVVEMVELESAELLDVRPERER